MSNYTMGDEVNYLVMGFKYKATVLDVIINISTLTGQASLTYLIGYDFLGLYKEDEVVGSMISKEEV